MTDADAWIEAVRLAHDDIADRARSFDADDLAAASGAREWNVAQVLGHLGSASEIGLLTLRAALDGTEPPELDVSQPIWDRWNALDNAGKAAGYLDTVERLVATLEAIDPEQRESLRIDLGYLPAPADLATVSALRLNELALHGWDVRVARDPHATLLPSSTDLLVDRGGALIGFIGHADAIDGSLQLRVETTSPERVFGLSIDDRVSLGDPPSSPDGILGLPAEAWLRLVAGRLAPEHTPADVKLESDVVTLDDLRRVFPGY